MITNYKEYKVTFHLYIGQEVYYLFKRNPKRGYIKEIDISIEEMNDNTINPVIKYRIDDNWYKEEELWTNKKLFQNWINENMCYIKNLECSTDNGLWLENANIEDEIKVKILSVFERINNKHPWKKRKIAEIFYFNKDQKPRFRFVPFEDIIPIDTPSNITGDKFELINKYGQHYVEDSIYNFVNYDGIKI